MNTEAYEAMKLRLERIDLRFLANDLDSQAGQLGVCEAYDDIVDPGGDQHRCEQQVHAFQ